MEHQAPPTAWNTVFQQEGKVFTTPHEDMLHFVEAVRHHNRQNVLDVGCGSGRHVVYLARHGFSVYGLDNAPEGLNITRRWLQQEGLSADLRHHQMTDPFPYPDATFDAVVSIQVIHHARTAEIQQIIAEMTRVLRPHGVLLVSVPKEKHRGEARREIEAGTYVPLDGPERGLPHHYFTEDEFQTLFQAFTLTDIHLDSTQHYCVWGRKRIQSSED